MIYNDRREAGYLLGQKLLNLGIPGQDAIIYALPRGGLEIGAEICKLLGSPLDIAIARKIGHPDNPEFAVCAISEKGNLVCDRLAETLDQEWLSRQAAEQQQEAQRRRQLYKQGEPSLSPAGKVAILVDDGVATGLTMLAALQDMKQEKAKKIVVAAPVMPPDFLERAAQLADRVIYLDNPANFMGAVGAHYHHFPQVSDEEVIGILSPYGPQA